MTSQNKIGVLLIHLFDIMLQGHFHGWGRHGRRFDIYGEPGIYNRLSGVSPESGETGIILFEIGEILEKGFDAGRAEESDDVKIHMGQITQIIWYCTVYHALVKLDIVLLH